MGKEIDCSRLSPPVQDAMFVPTTPTAVPTNAISKELSSKRRMQLGQWLGKTLRVVITDGRVLIGFFNCTDKDANLVLSMCAEYLEEGKDARILGNVMIPGKHIVSIAVDMPPSERQSKQLQLNGQPTRSQGQSMPK